MTTGHKQQLLDGKTVENKGQLILKDNHYLHLLAGEIGQSCRCRRGSTESRDITLQNLV